jgi:Xaa-Pro aminopeptidase
MNPPVPARLAALRHAMRERGIAFCLVPTADPHLSEYLPARWKTREWLSGFTGSAGTLVVGEEFAGLWTDSRYFEQAERELAGSGVELMKLSVPHTPEHLQWLRGHVRPGERVACAADMLSLSAARSLRRTLDGCGAELVRVDLPDDIWSGRPGLPDERVFEHPIEYAIRPRAEKLAAVREAMRKRGATHHLVSALDEIAWLTNLRGSDVEYNPVFLAYLLVDAQGATLFVDTAKLSGEAEIHSPLSPAEEGNERAARVGRGNISWSAPPPRPSPVNGGGSLVAGLRKDGFEIRSYSEITNALAALSLDSKLLLDPQHVCLQVAQAIPANIQTVEAPGPITALKARKNNAELAHVRETMRRDGAALVRTARWLETTLARGERLTELDVDERLRELRSQQPGFVSESFSTIAGYQANAALPHYRATPEHHSHLHARGMLLIDSGGQYLGGTTDITRVWALGDTTEEQRRDVTLVLKGVIALSRARFPRGTSGQQLDALARAPIWASGVDYGHGTGHGVGYCLNVHEGPQAIRPPRSQSQLEPLDVGMITSIEPGIYKPGRHGVRIENLVATISAGSGEFGEFLAFETLTLCPIDTRLIERDLLETGEIAWLDDYHARVREQLAPLLDDADDRAWLEGRCAPLGAVGGQCLPC